MKKFLFVLAAAIALLRCGGAFAQEGITAVQKNGNIILTVDCGKEEISIPILIKVTDDEGNVSFLDDNYTNEDGIYSVMYNAGDSSKLLTAEASAGGVILPEIHFIVRTANVERELYDTLSTQAAAKNPDSDEVKAVMEKYWLALEADDDLFNTLSAKDAVYDKMVNDKDNINVSSFDSFMDAFYKAVLLQKYAELENKNDILSIILKEPYKTASGKFAANQIEQIPVSIRGFVTNDMQDDYISAAEFQDALEFSILHFVIKESPLWSNVKATVEKYKEKIGIKENISNSKYKSIIGKSYLSYADIKAALTENKEYAGGGGSSGSKGNKGGGVVMTPSNPPIETSEPEIKTGQSIFVDMEDYKWAYEAVENMHKLGIISGDGNGKFSPERVVTRAEAAKMLVLLMNRDTSVVPESLPFEDVQKEHWSYPYIALAYASGVVKGKSSTYYGAEEEVTRQEIAVMAWNAMKLMGFKENGRELFNDESDIADWAIDAVKILGGLDIIHGRIYNGGFLFAPKDTVTRAEAAVIISNIANQRK